MRSFKNLSSKAIQDLNNGRTMKERPLEGKRNPKHYCVCVANVVVLPEEQSPVPHVRIISCCHKSPQILSAMMKTLIREKREERLKMRMKICRKCRKSMKLLTIRGYSK